MGPRHIIVVLLVVLLSLGHCHRAGEISSREVNELNRTPKISFPAEESPALSRPPEKNAAEPPHHLEELSDKGKRDETPKNDVPDILRMDEDSQNEIDQAVRRAVHSHVAPGFVVAVGRADGLVFLRAYGDRALLPAKEPMTTDTVFDLASITKPLATATSIMLLEERGELQLDDPVSNYIEEFGSCGKQAITIRQLLLHRSGLPAVNRLSEYELGKDKALSNIYSICSRIKPGTKVIYSDLGFIVLGELVSRISGVPLDVFVRDNIFQPLGMDETGYLPGESLDQRAAPTEDRDGVWIKGDVHDPRAWRLGGVSGNAGVFSTARDLARFCRMLLGKGRLGDVRILSEQSVEKMTTAHLTGPDEVRGLGWWLEPKRRVLKQYRKVERRFGHGGFTGTALWVDPFADLFVVVLSNRVHPEGKTASITPLVEEIIDTAKRAIPAILPLESESSPILLGIDVLRRNGFAQLAGARVGLISNTSGRARDGMLTRDLLFSATNVNLVALFSPEHGFGASREGWIRPGECPETGLPIYSLFGKTRKPTLAMLDGIDVLVFDLQDVGVRYYTYMSTMVQVMEAAGEHGRRFVVLDRPNPLGGIRVDGPVSTEDLKTFVNYHPLPIRHGMTVAELALLLKEQRGLKVEVEVVPLEGWGRSQIWQQTGLMWYRPSPNIRTPEQSFLYGGVGLLEGTNVSVGRGTEWPFEIVAAPWIRSEPLLTLLKSLNLSGVEFSGIQVVPRKSKFQGKRCHGVRLRVTDFELFEPVEVGFGIARALHQLYPGLWQADNMVKLVGDRGVFEALVQGKSWDNIALIWHERLAAFKEERNKFLIYE